MNRNVSFDLNRTTFHETYGHKEYARCGDMSTIRRRNVGDEWNELLHDLNIYKMTEMIVHVNSIMNTQLR
jgi:hypothetical protein